MQLDMSGTPTRSLSLPFFNLRWSAIFAGLVVGISTNLLLLLAGAAVGLAALDVGDNIGPRTIPMAAAIWNTVAMIVAAFVGGYVAARASGLHRASDGVLHGVVAWGATMIVSAFLATSVTGSAFGNMFASVSNRNTATAAAQVMGQLGEGDRQAAISSLQSRLGLSAAQANQMVDQALILSGREESASPEGRAAAEQAMRNAAVASGWLTAATLLSLLSAIGGGILGARSTRRVVHTNTLSTGVPPEVAAQNIRRGVE